MSLRSIRVLALWSVLSQMPAAEMERFAAWLLREPMDDAPAQTGTLEPLMRMARKMTPVELAELSDLVVAAVEDDGDRAGASPPL
ncbi:MAG: hypothetical protein M3N19_08495 [Candidatus Eremiobacteraeota bacterium]|nr:hypothetical protein [Candidatus Eremiobacteraeota bacterium]